MTQETEKKQEKTIRERVKAILEIWPEPISLRSRTPLAVEKKEGRAILYPGEFVLASSKEAGGTGMSEKSVFLWKREINMTNKGKPFIKWVGGKTQLIDSIENTLPKDFETRQDLTYIEPFVGGGAILFWILQKYPNIKKAVINDINPDLTTAYKTIKTKPKELVMKLRSIADEYLPLSEEKRKEYYLAKRDRFNTKFLLEPVENSALFIFLNRTCFNGLYRVNSRGLFNVPFGKYANPKICDEQTILADSELLQKVEILTGDFEETLKYATANSFFYFDPPYKPLSETSSFNSYAKEEFNDKEQIRLGSFCQRIDLLGHDFILSNSDVKGKNPDDNFFDDLYSQFEINRVFATRMVNADAEKRGKLTELLITNQQSKE